MPDEVIPVSSEGGTQAETAPPPSSEIVDGTGEAAFMDGELVDVEEKSKPPESFWQRLRKIVFGSSEGIEQRLRSLSLAIEKYPEAPANYVLRGELYLDVGEYELAQSDFQRALELASAQFEVSDWGGIAQVMRDRAEVGLEKARQQRR